jgi:hypothetical protein
MCNGKRGPGAIETVTNFRVSPDLIGFVFLAKAFSVALQMMLWQPGTASADFSLAWGWFKG